MESLGYLRKNNNLTLHFEAIEFYQRIFDSDSIFRSAAIVGSIAKEKADRLSDIDLIAFVEDINMDVAFEKLANKDPFPLVHSFQGKFEDKFLYKKSIFENYVSSEIHVAGKSTPFRLRKPFITLFDHDDFLPTIVVDGETPKHEDFPALNLGEVGLAWELHDLVKWWSRGRRDFVKNHILKIARKIEP